GAGHRHQHFVGMILVEEARQTRARAEHVDAVNRPADLTRIVVDEADRLALVEAVVAHVADDHFAGVAGTVDQHALLVLGSSELAVRPPREPYAAEHGDEQDRVDEINGPRIRTETGDRYDKRENTRTDDDGADDRLQIGNARVAPQTAIDLEQPECAGA